MIQTQTSSTELQEALGGLAVIKEELLLVLDDPCLPLHNNLSESQIREHVKRRKISGGTRSDAGRQCRDTFASLKFEVLMLLSNAESKIINCIKSQVVDEPHAVAGLVHAGTHLVRNSGDPAGSSWIREAAL